MTEECDGMLAALTVYRQCPNLEEGQDADLDAWIERATTDFTAGRKVKLSADAQQAIALACHRASHSVMAATDRCRAGKPPRTD